MKLEYKHRVAPTMDTDMVKHKAVLFIKTDSGKTYKFKNSRFLGTELGTTMYAERRQLQDILEFVEDGLLDGAEYITKEEMNYIKDHFDDLFFNKVLEFEIDANGYSKTN